MLKRAPTVFDLATVVFQMNNGRSRADVIASVSEYEAHRELTQHILNAGLWVPDEKATQIARLYDATFDRLPDAAGLGHQLAALNAGTSLLTLAANFAASPEFQARYGALSNQAFVEQLYRFCLDREGDAPGIAVQVNALNTGTSRAALLLAFSESPEHVALTAPLWSGGIRTVDPAFSGMVTEGSGEKSFDDQPLVLVPADEDARNESLPEVCSDANLAPQTQAPLDHDRTASGQSDDDAFVLPGCPEGMSQILPGSDADAADFPTTQDVLPPTAQVMLTLLDMDGSRAWDSDAWHRFDPHDGWMLH